MAEKVPAETILMKLPASRDAQVIVCKQLQSGKWTDASHTGLDEYQASRRGVKYLESHDVLGVSSAMEAYSTKELLVGPRILCSKCSASLPFTAYSGSGR